MAEPRDVDAKVSPTGAFNAPAAVTHTMRTTVAGPQPSVTHGVVSAPTSNDAQCLVHLDDVAKTTPYAVDVVCTPLDTSAASFKGQCKPEDDGFKDANGQRCVGEYTQPGKEPQKFMFTPNRPP